MKRKSRVRSKRRNEIRFHKTLIGKRNIKMRHPAYIWRERGNVYDYHGITHSKNVDGKDFVPLRENPNPKDKRKAFYNPNSESDIKSSFGRKEKKWKLNPLDVIDIHKK